MEGRVEEKTRKRIQHWISHIINHVVLESERISEGGRIEAIRQVRE